MNRSEALGFVFAALFFWGSWANSYIIAKEFHHATFEIFFIGFSIAAGLSCFYVIEQYTHTFWEMRLCFVAGFFANVGKVLLTMAVNKWGMATAIPLALGIEIFLGTLLLYIGDPNECNPYWLFMGVFLIMCAVCMNLLYQLQREEDLKSARIKALDTKDGSPCNSRAKDDFSDDSHGKVNLKAIYVDDKVTPLLANRRSSNTPTRAFCAEAVSPAYQRKTSERHVSQEAVRIASNLGLVDKQTDNESELVLLDANHEMDVILGLCFAIGAGICLAIWPMFFELQHHMSWREFYFGFALGVGCSSFITLPILWQVYPPNWEQFTPSVLILSMTGGFMMMTAIYLMYISQEELHFIVSMTIVRCSPIIGGLWGIVVWGELKNTSIRAKIYVGTMFFLYSIAISLIAHSILEDGDQDSEEK